MPRPSVAGARCSHCSTETCAGDRPCRDLTEPLLAHIRSGDADVGDGNLPERCRMVTEDRGIECDASLIVLVHSPAIDISSRCRARSTPNRFFAPLTGQRIRYALE